MPLEYVNSGDKILAGQYNALVDAVGGPIDPAQGTPFTRTRAGAVLNGGLGMQTTKAPGRIPLFLETSFGVGVVTKDYSAYDEQDPSKNRFTGVFVNIGAADNYIENCVQSQNGAAMGGDSAFAVIIDPTSEDPRVIPVARDTPTCRGKLPICRSAESAAIAVLQITACENPILVGDFITIIGNFKKLNSYGDGNRPDTVPKINLLRTVQAVALYSGTTDVRLMTYSTLWKGEHWLESNGNVPRVAFNVGTQKMEMLPDAMLGSTGELGQIADQYALSTYLSSIEQVPQAQVKFSPLNQTNTFGLFNFGREASDQLDTENLSSYDVLIRRKSPHPLGVAGRCGADLEYVPISALSGGGLHTGDANSPAHGLSSVYLSSDGQYELFDFHLSGTHHGLTKYDWQYGLSDEVEVIVRDNRTPGQSKVNYVPKSWLAPVGGDKNVLDARRSVEYVNNPDPYYQLYSFGDPTTIGLDPIRHHAGFDFVVRYHNAVSQREEIQYGKLDLSSIAPISGDANIIPNTQNTIITVEDQQGNKWHQLYRVGTEDPSIQVDCSFHTYDSGDYNYLLNEGNLWPNPEKQFVVYNQQTKRLEYVDVGLHIPKVTTSDLDDDVIPEISGIVIPEISSIISAELSALDDKYWIKGEDNTENYGSAIGNTTKAKVVDLNNRELVGAWSTDNDFTCDTTVNCDQVIAGGQVTIAQGGLLQIGSTTLNESQLQQLLALLNAPQRLQQL